MSRGCRPAPGAPRPAVPAPSAAAGAATRAPGRAPGSAGSPARVRAGSGRPAPPGARGKEAAGEWGGGGAGSLGRAATPRSPRPPPAVCAAGHSPISRNRGFTAQESRALPSHGGSRVALPAGPRQRQDPGRGGMDVIGLVRSRSRSCGPGKAPARFPAARAGLLPPLPADHGRGQSEGRLPAVPPRRTREPGRGHPAVGTRRTGKAPASPASPGRGSPAPPASAAPAPKRAARKIKWWERCEAP